MRIREAGHSGSKFGIRLRQLHRSALNFKSVRESLCELRIDLNYGPDFINTDFALIKHFILPYREGMRLDFRAEFFNVFNHLQFGAPTPILIPPTRSRPFFTFGVVNTTVNNPRVMQFALKLNF
jgi:hypothetical protein